VAMSSASSASTLQTAAFNSSSFSYGISHGFDSRVPILTSSSVSFFITEVRSSASVRSGTGEGGRHSTSPLEPTSAAFPSVSGGEVVVAGSFLITRTGTVRTNVKKGHHECHEHY